MAKDESAPQEKLKIGWFTFSCCEDNTVIMTEVMNDHWQEWKKIFDFKHARVLQSKNEMCEFDIAFVEGAVASPEHKEQLQEIRKLAKKLVAIGSCAVMGMPSSQRNTFNDEQKKEIEALVARFNALPEVLKVSDVVEVDAQVFGCPMDPNKFLDTVNTVVAELQAEKK